MKHKQRSAVVIGAGIAGLNAGFRLKQAGFKVKVLEKRSAPGGRVRTVREKGFIIDTGPDAVTEAYSEWISLAKDLGLGDRLIPSSKVVGIVKNGRIIDIDTNRTFSSLFTKAFSWKDKYRLARGALKLKKMLSGINHMKLSESSEIDDPNSNAQLFGEKYFGKEVADYLIDPMMRLVGGSGAPEISQLGVLGGFAGWSVPLINLLGGLDMLPKTAAEQIGDISYNTEAIRVMNSDGHVEVEYKDAGGVHSLRADVCVIGAMYGVAERIYPELQTIDNGFGDRIRDVKLISIALGYKKKTNSNAYVVMVPTVEIEDILLIFLQHNKAPDRAPSEHSLITFYTDNLATDKYLSKTDEEITQWGIREAEKLFPELKGHLVLTHIARWPKAGYLAYPGFWRHIRDVVHRLPADSRVQIAGDVFSAGSMETAASWGKMAARNLIDNFT